jgi:hypothetical protein
MSRRHFEGERCARNRCRSRIGQAAGEGAGGAERGIGERRPRCQQIGSVIPIREHRMALADPCRGVRPLREAQRHDHPRRALMVAQLATAVAVWAALAFVGAVVLRVL